MAQQSLADGLARWCKPESISPSSWITGFSDNTETFFCAIAGSEPDLAQKMEQHCCEGVVQESGDGCYHWCRPHAKETDEWANCISNNVYTDTFHFGQSCNAIGDLERKNKLGNGLELRPGPDPSGSGSTALAANWKLGVFLGLGGLLGQVLY